VRRFQIIPNGGTPVTRIYGQLLQVPVGQSTNKDLTGLVI
jgi:hypothetical protein